MTILPGVVVPFLVGIHMVSFLAVRGAIFTFGDIASPISPKRCFALGVAVVLFIHGTPCSLVDGCVRCSRLASFRARVVRAVSFLQCRPVHGGDAGAAVREVGVESAGWAPTALCGRYPKASVACDRVAPARRRT